MTITMDRLRLEVEAADPRNRLTFGEPSTGIRAQNTHDPKTWSALNGATITLEPVEYTYGQSIKVVQTAGGTVGQVLARSGAYAAGPNEVWRARIQHATVGNTAASYRMDFEAFNGATSLGVVATYTRPNSPSSEGTKVNTVTFTTPATTTAIRQTITLLTAGSIEFRLLADSWVSRGVATMSDWTNTTGTLTVTDTAFVLGAGAVYNSQPATPGKWAAAALDVTAGSVTALIRFYNGATLLTSTDSVTAGAGTRLVLPPAKAPASTTAARLVLTGTGGAAFTKAVHLVEASAFWARRTGWTESTRPNNLVDSSSGELGPFGWVTPAADTMLNAAVVDGRQVLQFDYKLYAATREIYFCTEPRPVTPGKYVGASWRMGYDGLAYRQKIEFLDAAMVVLASSTQTTPRAASASFPVNTYSDPAVVPAGANYARLRFDVALNYNGEGFYDDPGTTSNPSTPAYGGNAGTLPVTISEVVLAEGDTAAQASALPFIEATKWLDIIGPTFSIDITRTELDVGTINVTVGDPNLDPAAAPDVRPGKRFRFLARTPADVWEPVYTGKIIKGSSSYDPATGGVRTVLTAADGVKEAANVARPEGVGTINDLRAVLEGAGVPYLVNGSAAQISGAALVATNDAASALDQVVITRDTALGYAWVRRDNTMVVNDAANMPTVAVGTFDESVYSKPTIDFNTDACINEVVVKFLRYNSADQSTEEVVYGPYRNAASIAKWGRYAAEYTIQRSTESEAQIAAYAQAILTANSEPKVRINTISVPINTPADLTTAKALVDLYDLVRVVFAGKGIDETSRVTGIRHTVTPRGWLMVLEFGVDGAVAASQLTPSPSGPLAADDPGDTGWVNLTYESGFDSTTVGQLQARKVGKLVQLRGGGYRTSGVFATGTRYVCAIIPAQFRPSQNVKGALTGTSTRPTAVQLDPDGKLYISKSDAVSGNVQWSDCGLTFLLD